MDRQRYHAWLLHHAWMAAVLVALISPPAVAQSPLGSLEPVRVALASDFAVDAQREPSSKPPSPPRPWLDIRPRAIEGDRPAVIPATELPADESQLAGIALVPQAVQL